MKYYPSEISAKRFDRKMMGFDTDQVDDFLNIIAAQLEALLVERTQLKEEIRQKDIDLNQFKQKDLLINQTVTHSTQITEKMKSEAEREVRLILNDAQQKAELIQRDAKDSLRKMYGEIADLKKSKMQFEANLKAMIQAHLSLIDQSDHFLPKMRLQNFDLE